MGQLFGTDGVRGKAGHYPLDPLTIQRLGAALARALGGGTPGARFLSGRDTRESGPWIERALAEGIRSEGGVLVSAGVIPTPAIAFLTPRMGYTAGVVISASHNPFEDNGIKVFSGSGAKFTETLEDEVEAIVFDRSWAATAAASAAALEQIDYRGEYLAHLRRILPPASGPARRIVIDCGNGATTSVAPRLFKEIGFEVTCIGCEPDGRNINLECGSTAPELLARTVVAGGFPLGVAFDGDGDRAIFVDATGRIVDGDAVMLMCGKQMKAEGRLKGNAIVATVMSNIGLEIALRDAGIDMVRCPVGDKFVMEEMRTRDLALGGEQSGHVIFSEHLFTGDGIVTALAVVRAMVDSGRELSVLAGELVTFPQVLVNVRVKEKKALDAVPAIKAVTDAVETRLTGAGRLLIRYSGTEPLLRIMIEGKDQREIQGWADEIAAAVRTHLA